MSEPFSIPDLSAALIGKEQVYDPSKPNPKNAALFTQLIDRACQNAKATQAYADQLVDLDRAISTYQEIHPENHKSCQIWKAHCVALCLLELKNRKLDPEDLEKLRQLNLAERKDLIASLRSSPDKASFLIALAASFEKGDPAKHVLFSTLIYEEAIDWKEAMAAGGLDYLTLLQILGKDRFELTEHPPELEVYAQDPQFKHALATYCLQDPNPYLIANLLKYVTFSLEDLCSLYFNLPKYIDSGNAYEAASMVYSVGNLENQIKENPELFVQQLLNLPIDIFRSHKKIVDLCSLLPAEHQQTVYLKLAEENEHNFFYLRILGLPIDNEKKRALIAIIARQHCLPEQLLRLVREGSQAYKLSIIHSQIPFNTTFASLIDSFQINSSNEALEPLIREAADRGDLSILSVLLAQPQLSDDDKKQLALQAFQNHLRLRLCHLPDYYLPENILLEFGPCSLAFYQSGMQALSLWGSAQLPPLSDLEGITAEDKIVLLESLMVFAKKNKDKYHQTASYIYKEWLHWNENDPIAASLVLKKLASICPLFNSHQSEYTLLDLIKTQSKTDDQRALIMLALLNLPDLNDLSYAVDNLRDKSELFSKLQLLSLALISITEPINPEAFQKTDEYTLKEQHERGIDQILPQLQEIKKQYPELSTLIPDSDSLFDFFSNQASSERALSILAYHQLLPAATFQSVIPTLSAICKSRNTQTHNHLRTLFLKNILLQKPGQFLSTVNGICSQKTPLIRASIIPSALIYQAQNLTDKEKKTLEKDFGSLFSPCRDVFKQKLNGIDHLFSKLTIRLDLIDSDILSPEEKLDILRVILSSKPSEEQFKSQLSVACGLEGSYLKSFLISIKSAAKPLSATTVCQALTDVLETYVKADNLLPTEGLDNLAERFSNTIGSMREPNAWLVYEKGLREYANPQLLETYSLMMRKVLEGPETLRAYRYSNQSEHLSCLINEHPDLFKAWQEVMPAKQVALQQVALQSDAAKAGFSFKDFLIDKFQQEHFSLNGVCVFPRLAEALELQQSKDKTPQGLEALEQHLIDLLSADKIDSHDLSKLPIPKDRSFQQLQLLDDLKALNVKSKKSSQSSVFVKVSDDFQDLFLCGTEVAGSCQRVDGGAYLNKCLMGYVLDGKNQIVMTYDENTGQILSRGILRLLINEQTGSPVVFLEPTYPFGAQTHDKAIQEIAIEKAQTLGCPLYCSGSEELPLLSLGSPAPYEYSDSSNERIAKDGRFSIRGVKNLYMP
jgi:hypothetical protein